MVILIRSNDIVSDTRAMKYITYLRESKQDYKLIGWDRSGKMSNAEDTIYFRCRAGYNVGGFKAAINRFKWMLFVIKTLLFLKYTKLTIHACDLDAAFPSVIYSLLCGKKSESKIIFDIFDWFSATLYNQNKLILFAIKFMEKYSIKHSDYIIICEPERMKQIDIDFDVNKCRVLPNIPYFVSDDFLHKDPKMKFNNDLLIFSYVGGFYDERCLDEIIDLAEQGVINLHIAGFGDLKYENKLNDLSFCENIRYWGKVKYKDGLNIMYNSDIVYAMYETSNPNHIYAAPNKLYESLFLGKPIFTNAGTIVEKKVRSANIGFISGENIDCIKKLIMRITHEDIEKLGEMSKILWVNKYNNYTNDFMRNEYKKMII